MHRPHLAKVKELHALTSSGKDEGLAHTHTDLTCSLLVPPAWGHSFSTANHMVTHPLLTPHLAKVKDLHAHTIYTPPGKCEDTPAPSVRS